VLLLLHEFVLNVVVFCVVLAEGDLVAVAEGGAGRHAEFVWFLGFSYEGSLVF
jgi:hypothetical protein